MDTHSTPESVKATGQAPGAPNNFRCRSSLMVPGAAVDGPEQPDMAPRRFSGLALDGFEWTDIARVARSPLPILDFIIPNFLAGSVAVMVGPGGVSKSMLALQTAAVVGTGLDHWSIWTDRQSVKTGMVVVFNVEDPQVILDTRIHYISNSGHVLGNEHDFFIDAFAQNVRVGSLAGRGFAFGRKLPKSGRIVPTEWMEWVEEMVEGCRLAIFDTFIRGLSGLDENSSTEVAPVLAIIEEICRRKGVAFLILHHTNKNSANQPGAQTQQAARGASALTDNARWQTNLATMTKDQAEERDVLLEDRRRWVQVDLTKGNYGPPIEGRWLYRGDGGILDGSFQPTVLEQASNGQQPRQAKKANGHARSSTPYVDPRRRKPLTIPDEIDLQIPGNL